MATNRRGMPIMRRITALIALALVMTSLSILGSAPAFAEAEPKEATVTMQALRLDPARLEVSTGTTVIWTNKELTEYSVVRGTHKIVATDNSFSSPEIAPGQSWSKTFLSASEIAYRCEIHPQVMTGTLVVTGPTIVPPKTEQKVDIVEPKSTDTQSWAFDPKDITVDVGTTVTWRNLGAANHTVTADDGSFNGEVAPGAKFAFTFKASTSLRYHCEPHPWMTGTIVVREPGKAAPPPPPPVANTGSGSHRGTTPRVVQPVRSGNQPTTFNVEVVEPDVAKPMEWAFAPDSLGIRAGDSVVWTNTGAQQHTVTADDASFDSGFLAAGKTFTKTFDAVGTYRYKCNPHPWMKGVIQVVAADTVGEVAPPPPTSTEGPSTDVLGEQFTRPGATVATTPNLFNIKNSADRVRLAMQVAAWLLLIGAALLVTGQIELRRPAAQAMSIAPPPIPAAMEPLRLDRVRDE